MYYIRLSYVFFSTTQHIECLSIFAQSIVAGTVRKGNRVLWVTKVGETRAKNYQVFALVPAASLFGVSDEFRRTS